LSTLSRETGRMKTILKGCLAISLIFVIGPCLVAFLLPMRHFLPSSTPKPIEASQESGAAPSPSTVGGDGTQRDQGAKERAVPSSPELIRVEAEVAKLGLPESTRKQIYWEMGEAEYRAIFDSDFKYGKMATKTWMDSHDKLVRLYETEVAEKYKLTWEQADLIGDEALMKRWPLPSTADFRRTEMLRKVEGEDLAMEKQSARERVARPKSKLKAAENLEKMGKTKAAISFYREIVKDMGDSPEAKTAKARLRALAPGNP
jgi:hypothetical protein